MSGFMLWQALPLGWKTGGCIGLTALVLSACPSAQKAQNEANDKPLPSASPSSEFPPGSDIALLSYGKELLLNTPKHLGPAAEKPALRLASSNMSCVSCHLNGGKSLTAMGFAGIAQRYPRYRALENRKISLSERINSCFERSLNGKPLPAPEGAALSAYLTWLSGTAPQPEKETDLAEPLLPPIQLLDRAANPQAGAKLYQYHCAACHGAKGEGLYKDPQMPQRGFTFPPVAGPQSYGQGSNLNRLIIAARYIQANMPLGRPVLSAAEAFDIAAFISGLQRPLLAAPEKDYPDRQQKPVDVPYPPYADAFSVEQHQFGPFTPMLPPASAPEKARPASP
ncbi:MAG: c-type cytochrome [Candidatus Sericytochromatia bacterium]